MAEIGLIASLIGLVGAGTKLSIAIFDFASSIGHAGNELQHVAQEISLLCSVLEQLQGLLEHAHFDPEICPRIFGETPRSPFRTQVMALRMRAVSSSSMWARALLWELQNAAPI